MTIARKKEKLSLSQDEFLKLVSELKGKFAAMQPELEVTVRNPEEGIEGFVVVWNTGICRGGPFTAKGQRGMGKGGTRVMPGLTLEQVKRLARAMAEKNAAAGLPMGGSKSGLNADPSLPDYEKKFRSFVRKVGESNILFEKGGIFGGFGYDVGCRPPHNAIWACDELGTTGSFTGKPIDMGGTDYDREGIAGLGVAVAARTLLERRKVPVQGASFAVQGAGAMGAAVIRYFSEYGGTLKSLADPRYGGTWVLDRPAGAALIKALSAQDETAKKLLEQEGRLLAPDSQEVLYQDVDVLFPCAVEDVLTAENAGRVKARFVVEGANNPTRDEAHKILFDKGIINVPDIIANPGGIISAFVELTSAITVEENLKTRKKVQQAKDMTIDRVTSNVHELLDIIETYGLQSDRAGDFIAHRNIFLGIPS